MHALKCSKLCGPSSRRGFTLIELMVVITIIGILSAVVLAALIKPRQKGSDAALKENMHGLQAQAELYYYNHTNSYGPVGATQGACTAAAGADGVFIDPTVVKQVTGVVSANGGGSVTCTNSLTQFAVSAQMVENTTKYWCVDSAGGASMSSTALLTSVTKCP